MDWRIVDAGERHIAALEALEKRCFSLPWTEQLLRGQLRGPAHEFLAAEGPAGELLGYAGMTYVLDEGYISNVAVSPEARRQGIGDALVAALLERSRELGLSFVTLEVRRSNRPAIALYEKHGFRPVGLRRNYYEAPREDALLMTLFLTGAPGGKGKQPVLEE